MQPQNDPLWYIAKKRASFKKQLISYLIVISFLWVLWFANGREFESYQRFPWPAWIMFWWGIGLVFSYTKAYVINTHSSVEEEYRKLKGQQ